MVKICPKCGTNNNDSSFWCNKCNNRLIENRIRKEEFIDEDYDLPYDSTLKQRNIFSSMVKIPIAIAVIAIIIFSSIYFITNIGVDDFDWDRFGGYPWNEDYLPWENIDFPWVKSLSIDDITNSWDGSYVFSDISEIDDDYWFEGDSIITKTGWTFNITKVKDCNYKAKILDYYVYNKDCPIYKPSEIISQVDIFFGFDDIIENPNKYPYNVIYHFYRGVYVDCKGTSEAQAYFLNHVTNTHIIPHNQEVLNKLKTIDIGDIVTLTGSYVDIYGRHVDDDTTYSWKTDTEIGDSDCEIILVDSISVS
jgi:hypothetical protein